MVVCIFAYGNTNELEREKRMNTINISGLLKKKDRITLDVVGDSITWGITHCSDNETYTAQFAEMLAKKFSKAAVYRYDGITHDELKPMEGFSDAHRVSAGNCGKRIDVIRNGIGGNTVRRAINRIQDFTGTLANEKTADITFFMFGINDALKTEKSKYVTPEKFYDDYTELLEKFKATEKSQVVIMSATTNDQPINEYVKTTEKFANEHNILYINQNKVWTTHYDKSMPNFGHGDWLSSDPCHPTPKGANAIAKEMMRYVV